jgi:hypothetical protein
MMAFLKVHKEVEVGRPRPRRLKMKRVIYKSRK